MLPGKLSPMSSFFEEKFGDQLGSCNNGNRSLTWHSGWWIFGKSYNITAIPQNVLSAVTGKGILDQTVLPELDQSAARVFAYVFPNKNIPDSFQLSAYVDVDKLTNPQQLLPQGLSSIIYTGSCSATVALAMQAHAGLSWPIASFSSSLTADYNKSTSSQVGIIYGTFNSPLSQYLTSGDQKWKAYATLLFLEWYDAQGQDMRTAATPGYILSQFTGASAYQLGASSSSVSGAVNASSVLTVAAGSVQADGSVKYSNASTLTVTNYGVVFNSPIPDGNWTAIPALSSIKSLPVAASLDPKSTDYKLLQSDMNHTQILPGVPAEWCTSDRWHVINHNLSTTGTLHVIPNGTSTGADPKEGEPPTCLIGVEFSAPVAANKISLLYSLASSLDSNDDVNDDNAGANDSVLGTVVVKTGAVILSATGQPTISPTTASGMYSNVSSTTGGITFNNFSWTGLNYAVSEDPADKIAAVQPAPIVSASCGGGTRQIGNVVATVLYNSATALLSLSLTHNENDSVEKLDVAGTPDVCVLSGDVTITLQSGAVIQRTIPNTTIYYPKPISSNAISIASFSPTTGQVGQSVTLSGTGFLSANSVTFSPTVVAVYKVNSDTQLTVTVPAGAGTGKITVTGASGTASTSTPFTVTP
jgi:hypothetical protein